jgi:hypothetical protein
VTNHRPSDAEPRPRPDPSPEPALPGGTRDSDSAQVPQPSDASNTRTDDAAGSVAARLAAVIDEAVDRVESTATAVGAAAATVVGAARDSTTRRFEELPGARVRRVRRQAREPLKLLYEEHPDARSRTPRELGVRTIDVADIAGTAVGGARQRGGDFLPLKPFRSMNWQARWQRLNRAAQTMATLPPIDVLLYDDRYWVIDGHNRVAQALYSGQASIDADVTELVAPGRQRSDPPESFASFVDDSRELRAAVSRAGVAKGPPGPPDEPREPDPDR